MTGAPSIARCAVLALLVLGGGLLGARRPEAVSLAAPLETFPRALDEWRGIDQPPLDPETLAVLGADDYLNRLYRRTDGAMASVYVGFYGAQQQGDNVHSPRNCLPGNGWQPISRSKVTLRLDGRDATVNRYVVAKHDMRQLVLYWFEGRGRVVANEYVNKWFMLADGLRLGRSDGALIRLIAPIADGADPVSSSEPAADAALGQFGGLVHDALTRWLP